MKLYSPNKRIHFIGIGGIGVSALARYFLTQGHEISGSDIVSSEITDNLKKQGADIHIGHKAKNIHNPISLVIYSAAVQKNNPELKNAQILGIPAKSYSEALGDLTKKYKTIAVSGAHGKSTTTALLSLVLIKNGFDPTVIIGTKLKSFGDSNFRNGKSDYFIIEADEYYKSFLNYFPFGAIITNIDREHLDYYKNLSNIKKVFLKFISHIQPGGILVANRDDKNLFGLKNEIKKIANENQLKVYWYSIFPRQSALNNQLSAILKIFGEHNISNALAVYTLAKALGVKDKDILKALGQYQGAWRRMEYRGNLVISIKHKVVNNNLKTKLLTTNYNLPVYDDYAHHPTEIKATLSALRQKYSQTAKIICVFQPHQEKRLKALFSDFVKSFDNASDLIILDIYKVKGREEVSQNINSRMLARGIETRLKSLKNLQKQPFKADINLKRIIYLPSLKTTPNNLKRTIIPFLKPSDKEVAVILMGAGDIYKLTDALIK